SAGTLSNALGATVRSSGGGSGTNVLNAPLTNAGTLDVQRPLSISNTARTFDTSAGTLNLATGNTLTVSEGTTKIGGATLTGSGARTLALTGTNTLDVVNDWTLPAGGFVLSLGGTPTLTSSNVSG